MFDNVSRVFSLRKHISDDGYDTKDIERVEEEYEQPIENERSFEEIDVNATPAIEEFIPHTDDSDIISYEEYEEISDSNNSDVETNNEDVIEEVVEEYEETSIYEGKDYVEIINNVDEISGDEISDDEIDRIIESYPDEITDEQAESDDNIIIADDN